VSAEYVVDLEREPSILMHVRFTTRRRDVTNYAVLLTIEEEGKRLAVRLYDGAHGVNEMHRYTQNQRKELAEIFHSGTLGEGMRAATELVKRGYRPIIEAWRSR
jgi:hypothetical protein